MVRVPISFLILLELGVPSLPSTALAGELSEQATNCGALIRTVSDPVSELIAKVKNENKELYEIFKGEPYYRGFSRPDYSDKNLIANLFGDRKYDIRSWNYDRCLQKKTASGISIESAIKTTDLEIYASLENEIANLGVKEFVRKQMYETITVLDLEKKTAIGIPFGTDQHRAPVEYAWGNLLDNMRTASPSKIKKLTAIILKVKEASARGIPIGTRHGVEYFILSHLPANDIEGVFLGYPNFIPKKTISENWVDWFYLAINRSSHRKIESITVHRAKLNLKTFSLKSSAKILGKIATATPGGIKWNGLSDQQNSRIVDLISSINEHFLIASH